MNAAFVRSGFAVGCCLFCVLSPGHVEGLNVPEHHNHATRDGLYVDPAFTKSAAAGLKRDTAFAGTITGSVYAQPLYIEDGPGGKAMIIAVTEADNVYALDAANGSVIWQRNVGAPVPLSSLLCGNINPVGITGTPIVDVSTRSLYIDALTTPDNGATKRHLIYSLNVDTGTTNSGWPVDVNATAKSGTTVFNSAVQGQRGALALLNGTVYIPYGGNAGDCGTYHGWLVAIATDNPATVLAWATTARGGGAWAVGGVASDGLNPFLATGNTFSTTSWGGGESIIRFQQGLSFSGQTNDYWTPTNWVNLDNGDIDLGGSGPLIVDVPGANPSRLVVALGKDGNAYLLNRTNLTGVRAPVAQAHVSSSVIIQAAATYRTAQGTYVVCCGNNSQLIALRITATSPPMIVNGWTANQNGNGSPFVTSTDGTNNVIVWGIGTGSDQRLHGFDGDTGAVVFNGGGTNEVMGGTHNYNTGIAAHGRIYFAGDNKVYAFTVPVAPSVVTGLSLASNGAIQFQFTNSPGMSFTVFSSTNLSTPFTNWTSSGKVTEVTPGQFQFVDQQAANTPQRFYRVRSP